VLSLRHEQIHALIHDEELDQVFRSLLSRALRFAPPSIGF